MGVDGADLLVVAGVTVLATGVGVAVVLAIIIVMSSPGIGLAGGAETIDVYTI